MIRPRRPTPLGDATNQTTLLRTSVDGHWIGGITEGMVWIAECSRPDSLSRLPHAEQAVAIAFSTRDRVATGTAKGTIHLWDTVSGQNVGILDGHKVVHSLSFTQDGKTLISSGERVVFWESDRSTARHRSQVQSALPGLQRWVLQQLEVATLAEDVRDTALANPIGIDWPEVAAAIAVVANWLDAEDEGYPAPFNLFGIGPLAQAAMESLSSPDRSDAEYDEAARSVTRIHRRFPSLAVKALAALAQYRVGRLEISATYLSTARSRDNPEEQRTWRGTELDDFEAACAVSRVIDAMVCFRQGEVDRARQILATVDYGDRDGSGDEIIDEAIRLIQP